MSSFHSSSSLNSAISAETNPFTNHPAQLKLEDSPNSSLKLIFLSNLMVSKGKSSMYFCMSSMDGLSFFSSLSKKSLLSTQMVRAVVMPNKIALKYFLQTPRKVSMLNGPVILVKLFRNSCPFYRAWTRQTDTCHKILTLIDGGT